MLFPGVASPHPDNPHAKPQSKGPTTPRGPSRACPASRATQATRAVRQLGTDPTGSATPLYCQATTTGVAREEAAVTSAHTTNPTDPTSTHDDWRPLPKPLPQHLAQHPKTNRRPLKVPTSKFFQLLQRPHNKYPPRPMKMRAQVLTQHHPHLEPSSQPQKLPLVRHSQLMTPRQQHRPPHHLVI